MNILKKMNILIVEDDQMMQLGLCSMLKKKELNVIGIVENGNLAIKTALKTKPDIILMDIGLFGLDGVEATRVIKAALPDIRIIILTCYTNKEVVLNAMSSDADAYCVKGTNIEQLTAVIKIVADGSMYLDAKIADCVLTNIVSKTPLLTEEEVNEGKNYGFSQREIQVLKLLAQGKNNAEIAKILNLSVNTVKGHIRRILTKLSVSDRLKAVVKALELGIV